MRSHYPRRELAGVGGQQRSYWRRSRVQIRETNRPCGRKWGEMTPYYAMDDLFKVPDFTTWPGVAQLREHDSSRDDCIFPIIQVFELFKRDLEEEWAVG